VIEGFDATNVCGRAVDQLSWRIGMDQDREARIRARAYEIWEREGQQEGSHLAHWEQAEKELRDEEAGEGQQGGESAATAMVPDSGSARQPSGSTPSIEAEGGEQPADTGGGSTAGAPAKPRRSTVKKV
jgi:hypothetical protein